MTGPCPYNGLLPVCVCTVYFKENRQGEKVESCQ